MKASRRNRFLAVDLFSGAGGFSLGLEQAGFQVVSAADNWEPACQTYEANFQHGISRVDLGVGVQEVTKALRVPAPPHLVVGGPPCQGFSIQRIGSDKDHRKDLVLRFAEIAVALKPRVIVMENVPGLLGKRGAATAKQYVAHLQQSGYFVESIEVNAADFGLPQRRRRVIFLAWSAADRPAPRLVATHCDRHLTVAEAIGDLPSPPSDYKPHPDDPLHRRMKLSPLNQKRIALIPPGGGFEDLPPDLRVKAHKSGASRIGHRNVYGRLDPDRPAVTITARFDSFTRGKFAHPVEDRNISLREGARLQGFPDSFNFQGTQEQIAAQIGNAVPPPLAQAVGLAVVAHLGGSSAKLSHPVRADPELPIAS